jgi:hypothetical protein
MYSYLNREEPSEGVMMLVDALFHFWLPVDPEQIVGFFEVWK